MNCKEWLRKCSPKELMDMRELFREFRSGNSLIQRYAEQVDAELKVRATRQMEFMVRLDQSSGDER